MAGDLREKEQLYDLVIELDAVLFELEEMLCHDRTHAHAKVRYAREILKESLEDY